MNTAIAELEAVLTEIYDSQAQKFMLDLVMALINGHDKQAAIAVVEAKTEVRPSDRELDFVFKSVPALKSVRKHAGLLAQMAKSEHLSNVWLRLESGRRGAVISPEMLSQRPRKVMTSTAPIIALPGIQVAKMRFNRPLLEVLFEFLEHPEWSCGVVELATQRQLIVTESSARMILRSDYDRLMESGQEHLIRERVAAATDLKREDYFYLPDLEEFMRVTQQELEPNNPNSARELTWRGQSRDGSWVQYTHEYRLIEADGNIYHVGRNIAFEPIDAPVAV